MVLIRFFAGYREKTGSSEFEFPLEKEITIAELLEKIAKRYPEISNILGEGRATVALNHEVASRDVMVGQDDEIALFPPVSGG